MEVLTAKVVKTRKTHACWGCGREFQPGASLKCVEGVDDGHFWRCYWCDTCQAVIQDHYAYDADDGFGFGDVKGGDPDLWEAVRDEVESS